MDRFLSYARENFKAEAAEDMKRFVEEVVITLRERHDLELQEEVDRSIAENNESATARPDQGAAYSGSGRGNK